MRLFNCMKTNSVRESTVNSPPGVNRNHSNTATLNDLAGRSTSNPRTVQHTKVPLQSECYLSNKLHLTPQQYNLLHYSYLAKGNTLNLLRRFAVREQTDPEKLKQFDSRLTEAVGIKNQFITAYLKETKHTDKSHPLIAENYETIEVIKKLVNNPQKIKKLVYQSESRYFIDYKKFCPQEILEFNHDCQRLLTGTINDEPRVVLRDLCRPYAASGVVRRQLPTVKQEFEKVKKAGTVDRDFLKLIEQTIHNVEVGLRNMDHPARRAILETVAPKVRPVDSWEIAKVLGTNRIILDKSDSEIDNILKALKAIPLELI